MLKIIVINPGSTSTKIALYLNEKESFSENIHHSHKDLRVFDNILNQFEFRFKTIQEQLEKNNIDINTVDAFVARGGLLKPIPSGTYLVNDAMIADLKKGVQGEHASNLGALLANRFAQEVGKPAFIVDPVVVDEMDDIARLSGLPELPRKSIFHALNHKAVGRKVALELGKRYDELNLIIAHLGGGVSVAAHKRGLVVDVNNALDGEGPYTPERSGTLPAGDLVRLCFSGKYDEETIYQMIKGKGGVVAYLGVNEMQKVKQLMDDGDEFAKKVYQGLAYQLSKSIAALSAVFKGDIDGIVLTGGIAYDNTFIDWVKDSCSFLAPIFVYPGEEEMESLAFGALRVLNNKENAKQYKNVTGVI